MGHDLRDHGGKAVKQIKKAQLQKSQAKAHLPGLQKRAKNLEPAIAITEVYKKTTTEGGSILKGRSQQTFRSTISVNE